MYRSNLRGCIAIVAALLFLPQLASAQTSLRFYGDIDYDANRIKVRVDPHVAADVGATDFTIDFRIKAASGVSPSWTLPPGNSHSPAMGLPGGRWASRMRLSASAGRGFQGVGVTGCRGYREMPLSSGNRCSSGSCVSKGTAATSSQSASGMGMVR